MEKTFEEKFGLKTEELEEIIGGVGVTFTESSVSVCTVCTIACLTCWVCVTCDIRYV